MASRYSPCIVPRQTTVRLTPTQSAAVATTVNELTEHDVPVAGLHSVIETMEDGLAVYWECKRQHVGWLEMRLRLRLAPAAIRHARRLLALLPVLVQDDDHLMAVLEERVHMWETMHGVIPPLGRHRPRDDSLFWPALCVVRALDADAGVPLTVGRQSAVVEVLGLFRHWAGRTRAARKWRSADNEFARVVIDHYRQFPATFHPDK